MVLDLRAAGAALVSAALAIGCSDGRTQMRDTAGSSIPLERAGTLSVSAFDISGWHDDAVHYLPTLTVTAPMHGRAVFVQRVDFTTDGSGGGRLLKGVKYDGSLRIQPGASAVLVPAGPAGLGEIVSPVALATISAIVFFTDEDGQSAVVSASRAIPDMPDRRVNGPIRR